MKLIYLMLSISFLVGCASSGQLSQEQSNFLDEDLGDAYFLEEKVHSYREGSTGGENKRTGGGCGCN